MQNVCFGYCVLGDSKSDEVQDRSGAVVVRVGLGHTPEFGLQLGLVLGLGLGLGFLGDLLG